MHIYVHCSTIYNNKYLETPKHPPTNDKWIKKWYIYITEYYLTIKKNEILPFVTIWMDLKCIMLSEINKSGGEQNWHVESKNKTDRQDKRSTNIEKKLWKRDWRGWVKKVKGLKSTNWQLKNCHGDVKYNLGYIINKHVWC